MPPTSPRARTSTTTSFCLSPVKRDNVEHMSFSNDGSRLQLTAVDGHRATVVALNDSYLIDILATRSTFSSCPLPPRLYHHRPLGATRHAIPQRHDDDDDCRPLRLAVGDSHGCIAVRDACARAVLHWLNLNKAHDIALGSRGGVQDLYWVHHGSDGCDQ
jgi:hypothetical protein